MSRSLNGESLSTSWIIVLLILMTTCSGCSVAMALAGNQQPNFEAFDIGSTRKQVEIQLGNPVKKEVLDNGDSRDTYHFEMGNSPNGHRAIMNLYIDVATLLLWELPATIIEARMGEDQETIVVYDKNDEVINIEGYRPPMPSGTSNESIDAKAENN